MSHVCGDDWMCPHSDPYMYPHHLPTALRIPPYRVRVCIAIGKPEHAPRSAGCALVCSPVPARAHGRLTADPGSAPDDTRASSHRSQVSVGRRHGPRH